MDNNTQTGWVYFIQHGGPQGAIKIGTTAGNPYGRLRALQTGAPEALRLLAAMPGDPRAERALHEKFAAHRVREGGEWFCAAPDLLAFIDGVLWSRREEQPTEDDPDAIWQDQEPCFRGLTLGQVDAISVMVDGAILQYAAHAIREELAHYAGLNETIPASTVAAATAMRDRLGYWIGRQHQENFEAFHYAFPTHLLKQLFGELWQTIEPLECPAAQISSAANESA